MRPHKRHGHPYAGGVERYPIGVAPQSARVQAGGNGVELRGRVLWSCVNALKPDYTGLSIGFDNSAAEEVARHAPGARVVAAVPPFAQAIASRRLGYDRGLEPTVFVCGDDAAAKLIVERLVADLGAHAVDAGPLVAARLAEPAMMLAISIAYAGVPRDVGLRLLERTSVAPPNPAAQAHT